MMKISTSLIRIRYAVGVMLALSAVFAVVIGTSTLQPRDATAQAATPPTFTSSATFSVSEGQTLVGTVIATPETSTDSVAYTIPTDVTGGADRASFTIEATSGVLIFSAVPDYEAPADLESTDPVSAAADNVYIVNVVATDSGTNLTMTQTIMVTVTDVPGPRFTTPASFSVEEGDTDVFTVAATGAGVTYSVPTSGGGAGEDAARFSIVAASGALTFNTAPDYEAPSDANADNVYLVNVLASQASGEQTLQAIRVRVTDVQGPTFTSSATRSVVENTTTAVVTVAAAAAGGGTIAYTVPATGGGAGVDADDFAVDSTTGALTFNTAPNYEAPADTDADNVYTVNVLASETGGTSDEQTLQTITVRVTDVQGPTFTSSAAPSVAENTTAVVTVAATAAGGGTVTYAISGGADVNLFDATLGGANSDELVFAAAPDYENPGDMDMNNVYLVNVLATETGGTDPEQTLQTLRVRVSDVQGPTFTSSAAPSVEEGNTFVGTVAATSAVGGTVTYSIPTGNTGADGGSFSIVAPSGALSFGSAPDYENPGDVASQAPAPVSGAGDNEYIVNVLASEAGGDDTLQTLRVTVTNTPAPFFTSDDAFTVAEGSTAVGTVEAGAGVTYAIVAVGAGGGADAAQFAINGTSGALTFSTVPNYEAPADVANTAPVSDAGDNVYVVTVSATNSDSDTPAVTQTIMVTVTDVQGPSFTSSATYSVPESTNTFVGTVAATPVTSGADVTYTLTGTDAADFNIDANSGALDFASAPDYETPTDDDTDNVYEVNVVATEAGGEETLQAVTVTVTNVGPTITSTATETVAENTPITTPVLTVEATPVTAGAVVTFNTTLTGADAADFSIDGASGVLTFAAVPNYEAPADDDTDNVYVATVEVQETGGEVTRQTITVTVTDVAGPRFTSATTATVAEGTDTATAVLTVQAAGAGVTYSIPTDGTGGADFADFAVDGTSGELTFTASPNYEAPADDDTDNVYMVNVLATQSGGEETLQAFTVTVTNVGPTFTSSGEVSVVENTPITTAVVMVAATPVDTANTVTYSIPAGVAGGPDGDDASGALVIGGTDNDELLFAALPDYEAPADDDTDNVYMVNVLATEAGGDVTQQTITVTVTNARGPTFTSDDAPSVAENTTAVVTVAATPVTAANNVTYSITGGADESQFRIVSATGELSFVNAPDFESPDDADTDNVYIVEVMADEANGEEEVQTVTVTVTNVGPTFSTSSAAHSVAEDSTAIGMVSASPAVSGATVSYFIVGGEDIRLITINRTSGELSFVTAVDYEAPADANADNVYIVDVVAVVPRGERTQLTVMVTVTDVNEDQILLGAVRILRIEPTIRGITVSAGDNVRLSVDVYGLQDVKAPKLAENVTFDWSVDPAGGTFPTAEKGNSTVTFTAPSSPGEYTVTSKLGANDCYDVDAKVGEETAGCDADFVVRVRRQPAPQADDPAPVNPPGAIPELIPDEDGNQYDVFTPVEGGMFDGGEGYSISVPSGAVPNGEFIGIRMSDDGAASNAGQTHQRYTLAGNMYGVYAVDASGATISSYVLEDPAEVCVPLPASARANLTTLSIAAINSDDSLTILAAQARLNPAGDTMICGNLSNLPASVAVGSQGAPDAIPTATPVPEPVLPDTGGTSPASGGLVWVLLLGAAVVVSGTFVVVGRRRKTVLSK